MLGRATFGVPVSAGRFRSLVEEPSEQALDNNIKRLRLKLDQETRQNALINRREQQRAAIRLQKEQFQAFRQEKLAQQREEMENIRKRHARKFSELSHSGEKSSLADVKRLRQQELRRESREIEDARNREQWAMF